MYIELAPAEALATGFTRDQDTPFLVRWDRCDADTVQSLVAALPPTVDLHSSGSTGSRRLWRRTREQMWDEAGLLAGLLASHRPEGILACAPPAHIFGALATILVPARMRLPVWYRPGFFGPMPPQQPARRWAVVAIPWTFTLLRRRTAWVRAASDVTVLHSTATLPAEAAGFLAAAGEDRASLIEVFGSTETGGVAMRSGPPDGGPWTLLPDVEYDYGARTAGAEGPLCVRSPRLAFEPGGAPPAVRRLDDIVEPLDDRSFRFAGRRHRLVKVNGRRFELDALEESARARLRCVDLACVPVADALIGEHFDVLVVTGDATTGADVHRALAGLEIRPRRVHLVDRIDRSATGKLRRVGPPSADTAETGADT